MEEARGAGEEGELRCGTQVSGWSKRVNLVSCRRQEVEGLRSRETFGDGNQDFRLKHAKLEILMRCPRGEDQ